MAKTAIQARFHLPTVETQDVKVQALTRSLEDSLHALEDLEITARMVKGHYVTQKQRDQIIRGIKKDTHILYPSAGRKQEKQAADEFRQQRQGIMHRAYIAERRALDELQHVRNGIEAEIQRLTAHVDESKKKQEEHKKKNEDDFARAIAVKIAEEEKEITRLRDYLKEYAKETEAAIKGFTTQDVRAGFSDAELEHVRHENADFGYAKDPLKQTAQAQKDAADGLIRVRIHSRRHGWADFAIGIKEDKDPQTGETVAKASLPAWALRKNHGGIIDYVDKRYVSRADRAAAFRAYQDLHLQRNYGDFTFADSIRDPEWRAHLIALNLELSREHILEQKKYADANQAYTDQMFTLNGSIAALKKTDPITKSLRKAILKLENVSDDLQSVGEELSRLQTLRIRHNAAKHADDGRMAIAKEAAVNIATYALAACNEIAKKLKNSLPLKTFNGAVKAFNLLQQTKTDVESAYAEAISQLSHAKAEYEEKLRQYRGQTTAPLTEELAALQRAIQSAKQAVEKMGVALGVLNTTLATIEKDFDRHGASSASAEFLGNSDETFNALAQAIESNSASMDVLAEILVAVGKAQNRVITLDDAKAKLTSPDIGVRVTGLQQAFAFNPEKAMAAFRALHVAITANNVDRKIIADMLTAKPEFIKQMVQKHPEYFADIVRENIAGFVGVARQDELTLQQIVSARPEFFVRFVEGDRLKNSIRDHVDIFSDLFHAKKSPMQSGRLAAIWARHAVNTEKRYNFHTQSDADRRILVERIRQDPDKIRAMVQTYPEYFADVMRKNFGSFVQASSQHESALRKIISARPECFIGCVDDEKLKKVVRDNVDIFFDILDEKTYPELFEQLARILTQHIVASHKDDDPNDASSYANTLEQAREELRNTPTVAIGRMLDATTGVILAATTDIIKESIAAGLMRYPDRDALKTRVINAAGFSSTIFKQLFDAANADELNSAIQQAATDDEGAAVRDIIEDIIEDTITRHPPELGEFVVTAAGNSAKSDSIVTVVTQLMTENPSDPFIREAIDAIYYQDALIEVREEIRKNPVAAIARIRKVPGQDATVVELVADAITRHPNRAALNVRLVNAARASQDTREQLFKVANAANADELDAAIQQAATGYEGAAVRDLIVKDVITRHPPELGGVVATTAGDPAKSKSVITAITQLMTEHHDEKFIQEAITNSQKRANPAAIAAHAAIECLAPLLIENSQAFEMIVEVLAKRIVTDIPATTMTAAIEQAKANIRADAKKELQTALATNSVVTLAALNSISARMPQKAETPQELVVLIQMIPEMREAMAKIFDSSHPAVAKDIRNANVATSGSAILSVIANNPRDAAGDDVRRIIREAKQYTQLANPGFISTALEAELAESVAHASDSIKAAARDVPEDKTAISLAAARKQHAAQFVQLYAKGLIASHKVMLNTLLNVLGDIGNADPARVAAAKRVIEAMNPKSWAVLVTQANDNTTRIELAKLAGDPFAGHPDTLKNAAQAEKALIAAQKNNRKDFFKHIHQMIAELDNATRQTKLRSVLENATDVASVFAIVKVGDLSDLAPIDMHPQVVAAKRIFASKNNPAVKAAELTLEAARIEARDEVKARVKKGDIADNDTAINAAVERTPAVATARHNLDKAYNATYTDAAQQEALQQDAGVKEARDNVVAAIHVCERQTLLRDYFISKGTRGELTQVRSADGKELQHYRLKVDGRDIFLSPAEVLQTASQLLQQQTTRLAEITLARDKLLEKQQACMDQSEGDVHGRVKLLKRLQGAAYGLQQVVYGYALDVNGIPEDANRERCVIYLEKSGNAVSYVLHDVNGQEVKGTIARVSINSNLPEDFSVADLSPQHLETILETVVANHPDLALKANENVEVDRTDWLLRELDKSALKVLRDGSMLTQLDAEKAKAEAHVEEMKQRMNDTEKTAPERIAREKFLQAIHGNISSPARQVMQRLLSLLKNDRETWEDFKHLFIPACFIDEAALLKKINDADTPVKLNKLIAFVVAQDPLNIMRIFNTLHEKQKPSAATDVDYAIDPEPIMDIIRRVASGIPAIEAARKKAREEIALASPAVEAARKAAKERLRTADLAADVSIGVLNTQPEVLAAIAAARIFSDKPNVTTAREAAKKRLIELDPEVRRLAAEVQKAPQDKNLEKQLGDATKAAGDAITADDVDQQIEVIVAINAELETTAPVKAARKELLDDDALVQHDRIAHDAAKDAATEADQAIAGFKTSETLGVSMHKAQTQVDTYKDQTETAVQRLDEVKERRELVEDPSKRVFSAPSVSRFMGLSGG